MVIISAITQKVNGILLFHPIISKTERVLALVDGLCYDGAKGGTAMTETQIDNQQKYANYTEQFKRLSRAMTGGFHLEAMFIEYAIMEDRTESILRHADLWDAYLNTRNGREPTINSKIRYIQKRATNRKHILNKYFSDDLLDRILSWKDERNRLIHALLLQQLAHNEVRDLAMQGNELTRTLRSRSGALNRAIEKQQNP
jgi:hypothetical protein